MRPSAMLDGSEPPIQAMSRLASLTASLKTRAHTPLDDPKQPADCLGVTESLSVPQAWCSRQAWWVCRRWSRRILLCCFPCREERCRPPASRGSRSSRGRDGEKETQRDGPASRCCLWRALRDEPRRGDRARPW